MSHVDDSIAKIGLASHPEPYAMAEALRSLADLLDESGKQAIRTAPVLAARGFPTSTIGDGGSRSTEGTSSTERGGTQAVPIINPRTNKPYPPSELVRFHLIDSRLAAALATAYRGVLLSHVLIAEVVMHADDIDALPAGTGSCLRCGRFCRPTADRPDNRLRSKLCDACRKAWTRASEADRSLTRGEWLRRGQAALRAAEHAHGKLGAEARADVLTYTDAAAQIHDDGADIAERLNPGHPRKAS